MMLTNLHLEHSVTIVDPKDDIHMERYVSEEVVLNCEISRSNGEAHWFKDGLKLQESENVRLSAEGPYRRVTILCASKRILESMYATQAVTRYFFSSLLWVSIKG